MGSKSAKKITPTPITPPTAAWAVDRRMDPCFHAIYVRFLSHHPHVEVKIRTHQTRKCFFKFVISHSPTRFTAFQYWLQFPTWRLHCLKLLMLLLFYFHVFYMDLCLLCSWLKLLWVHLFYHVSHLWVLGVHIVLCFFFLWVIFFLFLTDINVVALFSQLAVILPRWPSIYSGDRLLTGQALSWTKVLSEALRDPAQMSNSLV